MGELKHKTAELDGVGVHYVEARPRPSRPSTSTRPPILLIHGLGASWLTWQLNIQPLVEAGYTVIALDLPGHGDSAKPQGLDYHPEGGAELVHVFQQALGIPKAILVGNSAGGLIAALVALNHPDAVDRLVLAAPGGLGREVSWPLRLVSLPLVGELVYLLGLIDIYDVRKSIFHRPPAVLDQLWPEMQRINDLPGARQAALRGIRSSINIFGQRRERMILSRLEALKTPVLAVWGQEDRIIPAYHASLVRERLPDSLVEIIPDCGHWPHMEQARRFNHLLIQFLADDGPPDP